MINSQCPHVRQNVKYEIDDTRRLGDQFYLLNHCVYLRIGQGGLVGSHLYFKRAVCKEKGLKRWGTPIRCLNLFVHSSL